MTDVGQYTTLAVLILLFVKITGMTRRDLAILGVFLAVAIPNAMVSGTVVEWLRSGWFAETQSTVDGLDLTTARTFGLSLWLAAMAPSLFWMSTIRVWLDRRRRSAVSGAEGYASSAEKGQ